MTDWWMACCVCGLEAAVGVVSLVTLVIWMSRLYQRDELAGYAALYVCIVIGLLCVEYRLYYLYFRELLQLPAHHHRHLLFFNDSTLWWIALPKLLSLFVGASLYGSFLSAKRKGTPYANLLQSTLLAVLLLPLLALWLRFSIFLYFIQFAPTEVGVQ